MRRDNQEKHKLSNEGRACGELWRSSWDSKDTQNTRRWEYLGGLLYSRAYGTTLLMVEEGRQFSRYVAVASASAQ
jgi:hypothetical protein